MKTDQADILLKGTGLLNQWDWPKIPGLHDFKGPYMHSANWDESFDWTNKTVALIGSGSSGIQILPQIQPPHPLAPAHSTFTTSLHFRRLHTPSSQLSHEWRQVR